MKKQEPIDYGNVPIKKLPPGKAFGADDLHRWSMNRAVGASGSGERRTKSATLKCRHCKQTTNIIVSVHEHKNKTGGYACRHCGKRGLMLLKFRTIDP